MTNQVGRMSELEQQVALLQEQVASHERTIENMLRWAAKLTLQINPELPMLSEKDSNDLRRFAAVGLNPGVALVDDE